MKDQPSGDANHQDAEDDRRLMAIAGLVAHLGTGQVTALNGIISGAFCWLGFVATTLVVSNTFAMSDMRLIWIDGGHWLIVLVLMGAIIGLMGV